MSAVHAWLGWVIWTFLNRQGYTRCSGPLELGRLPSSGGISPGQPVVDDIQGYVVSEVALLRQPFPIPLFLPDFREVGVSNDLLKQERHLLAISVVIFEIVNLPQRSKKSTRK